MPEQVLSLSAVPCRIYSQFYQKLDSPEEIDEEDRLDELWQLGEQYIASALQLCQTKDLQNIWERQDRSFMESETSHELKLWLVPAVDEHCSQDVQEGRLYNVVPADQMQHFVSSLESSAKACCPEGITAQVRCRASCQPGVNAWSFCRPCWLSMYSQYRIWFFVLSASMGHIPLLSVSHC